MPGIQVLHTKRPKVDPTWHQPGLKCHQRLCQSCQSPLWPCHYHYKGWCCYIHSSGVCGPISVNSWRMCTLSNELRLSSACTSATVQFSCDLQGADASEISTLVAVFHQKLLWNQQNNKSSTTVDGHTQWHHCDTTLTQVAPKLRLAEQKKTTALLSVVKTPFVQRFLKGFWGSEDFCMCF